MACFACWVLGLDYVSFGMGCFVVGLFCGLLDIYVWLVGHGCVLWGWFILFGFGCFSDLCFYCGVTFRADGFLIVVHVLVTRVFCCFVLLMSFGLLFSL